MSKQDREGFENQEDSDLDEQALIRTYMKPKGSKRQNYQDYQATDSEGEQDRSDEGDTSFRDFSETRQDRAFDESNRLVIHRTWRAQIFQIIGYLILCALVVPLTNLSPDWTVIKGELFTVGDTTWMLHLPILTFLPFLMLLKILYFMYDARYIIDGRGVEAQIGLVSLSLRQPRLRFEDIRGVEPKQTLLERFLGVGTLLVGSAMTFDIEIEMQGISNPREIQHLINKERDKQIKWLKRAGGAGVSSKVSSD